jgi:hypothetical protein
MLSGVLSTRVALVPVCSGQQVTRSVFCILVTATCFCYTVLVLQLHVGLLLRCKCD